MKCILAEKPSVALDIANVVGATQRNEGYVAGNGYLVTWAYGHLVGLAMPEAYGYKQYKAEDLPICPKPFELMVRQVYKGKEASPDPTAVKQLKVIKDCFDRCDEIIVGTDAGREGELIFRYIYEYLSCRKPFKRLWISSLTDKAIKEGLAKLQEGHQYDRLYASAKARSEADWQVGINASRALSLARRGAYSLGRVQTPTLAMVCRRFIENRDFKTVPYWKLNAVVLYEGLGLEAVCSQEFSERRIADSELDYLQQEGRLSVVRSIKTEKSVEPPLLYDLTTLQKEANKRYGFSADKTLALAQSLYEKKVTTYPRTGSRYISDDILEQVPRLLEGLGVEIQTLNRHSVNASKVTDHHAIIVTGQVSEELSKDEQAIYEMVRLRFIEAFAPSAREEHLHLIFSDARQEYHYRAKKVVFLGWRAYGKAKEEGEDENVRELVDFPKFTEGEVVQLSKAYVSEHQTKAKPIYTEASLLSAMEYAGREVEDEASRKAMSDCGIGTPATRASIIETLINKSYVYRDKKKLLPTDKGLAVYELIKDYKIANAEMTGYWEHSLSLIEEGKKTSESFSEEMITYSRHICEELLAQATTDGFYPKYVCPKCSQESIRFYEKTMSCEDKTCGFVVFRNSCGTYLTDSNLQALLQSGKTPLLKGLVGKSGKKFNAKIILKDDFSQGFEFEPNKAKKK